MGNVITTHFRLVNNTNTDIITTSVSAFDNYDWEGNIRINANFENAYIPAGSFKEEREDINGYASINPFNMALKFKDGTTDEFRINMRYAATGSNCMFSHWTRSHDISYRRSDNNTLIVTVDNTNAQKENILAEQRNKEGEAMLKKQRYKEALEKFEEAKKKANQSATISKINHNKILASEGLEKKKENDKALKLNNEGLVHMRNKNYQLAREKYEEALRHANLSTTISLIQHNKEAVDKKEKDSQAQKLNQEGEDEMKQENYENALKKFEEASTLANEYWTIRSVTKNLNQAKVAYEPEKLNKEGQHLMRMKKYAEAKKKFEEALTKTSQTSLIDSINSNLDRMGDMELNDKALKLNNEGLVFMRGKNYEDAIKKFEEALKFATLNTTVSFIQDNKQASIKKQNDAKADALNKKGEDEMKKKNYLEAMKMFEEASGFMNDYWITRSVKKNLENSRESYVQKMNAEGEELMKEKKFEEAITKFEVALGYAKNEDTIETISKNKDVANAGLSAKLRNENAQKLNKQGVEKMHRKQFKTALQKFDEALILANEESTINSIKINQSDVYNRYGKQLFEEGLTLERNTNDAKAKEASKKFDQAEEKFGISVNLHRTIENENNLKNIKIKIAANNIFNEAVGLEVDANKLFDNKDYNKAEEVWKNALEKYKEAKKKFEEGSMFGGDVQLVAEEISALEDVIADVKIVELNHDISKVHVVQKTKNDVDRDTKQEEEEEEEEKAERELVISDTPN